MSLLQLENISLSFGEHPILDQVNLQIKPNERLFLIGRNGMGKSSLLKIISKKLVPDDGRIHVENTLKISELSQVLPEEDAISVYDMVASGLETLGNLLKQYHHLILDSANSNQTQWLKDLETVQHEIEIRGGWHYQQNIEKIISSLHLPENKKMNELSGGWKRRVALARALVSEPDLLLLDEPTNHLDLEAIEWLEDFLKDYPGTVLCITHDRTLLRKLSTRILELDRGQLTSWPGNYDQYLKEREHRLEVEQTHHKLFDKKLAQEEAWIRQGIKARRTRNEGRVRALYKLRAEKKERRTVEKRPTFTSNVAEASGKSVIQAENLNYQIGNQTLVENFSIHVQKGEKIALIGPNGVGKSTLLKLLLGQLAPTSGKLTLGTQLEIGYFDQLRSHIRPELSATENVAGGRESIVVNGQQKHVISYLGDFLFTPEKARTHVQFLSGGECNRLLLAKLFSLPSNLLVLDEPTNDLDIETLELLEELLISYPGTVLLVSHDRTFVDNVVTSTLYFSGNGKITEYVGGYSDIPKEAFTKQKEQAIEPEKSKVSDVLPPTSAPKEEKTKSKLNYKLKNELAQLPDKIAKLEAEHQKLQTEMASPEFYQKDKQYVQDILKKLASIDTELKESYNRWAELE